MSKEDVSYPQIYTNSGESRISVYEFFSHDRVLRDFTGNHCVYFACIGIYKTKAALPSSTVQLFECSDNLLESENAAYVTLADNIVGHYKEEIVVEYDFTRAGHHSVGLCMVERGVR